jgi:hypothetical protein
MSSNGGDWATVDERQTAVNDRLSVAVQVNRFGASRKFSICIGARFEDDGLNPPRRFIPLRTHGQGRVEVESLRGTVDALVAWAEERVRELAQATEDAVIDRKLEREQTDLDRLKPAARPGLKKLGKSGA